MSTLCLLEVSQLRTKAVDDRGALQTKKETRNKSNDYFDRLRYMGYWAVVKIFFHLASKWSKWRAQTLHPFSQIFKFFWAIRAPIVALAKILKTV